MELNKIQRNAEAFSKLLDIEYYFCLSRNRTGFEVILNFTKEDYHHLANMIHHFQRIVQPKENEIYGLFVQGSDEVEGLVAIDPRRNRDALYVTWMVAAPHNNVEICGRGNQKYVGVGGHLFAIAISKSVQYGYGGAIYGFAKDAEKLAHYEKWFGAEYIGMLHEFHFLIADSSAVNVVEDYSYDETGEEL